MLYLEKEKKYIYRLFVLGTEQFCQVRHCTHCLTILLSYIIEGKYSFTVLLISFIIIQCPIFCLCLIGILVPLSDVLFRFYLFGILAHKETHVLELCSKRLTLSLCGILDLICGLLCGLLFSPVMVLVKVNL